MALGETAKEMKYRENPLNSPIEGESAIEGERANRGL
jgi:hypothetical protein